MAGKKTLCALPIHLESIENPFGPWARAGEKGRKAAGVQVAVAWGTVMPRQQSVGGEALGKR